MPDRVTEVMQNHYIGAKRFIPYVLIFIVIILLIPVYIKSFAPTSTRKTLYLAAVEDNMALTVSTVFVELLTYYPQHGGSYSGFFEVTTTSPSSLTFQVINSAGQNVTNGYSLAQNISSPSVVNFINPKGGSITLKYTNSLSTNYITRVDIVVN
jgi:hypothetical protein